MATPTIILAVIGTLLVWAQRQVGVTASISRLFYHNKTKKAFKAALWACGSTLVLHDTSSIELTIAGLSLIGVPIFGDFENRIDLTQYAHYLLAFAFYFLTALYIGPWMLAAIAIGTVAGLLLIKENKLYWLEVIGIVFLISGFYII